MDGSPLNYSFLRSCSRFPVLEMVGGSPERLQPGGQLNGRGGAPQLDPFHILFTPLPDRPRPISKAEILDAPWGSLLSKMMSNSKEAIKAKEENKTPL
jgi:hypothetical protein